MRMLSGRPLEVYSFAKFLTESSELTSSSMTSMVALGQPFIMVSLHLLAASTFLAAITTCTPRKARTRVVSRPMPLVGPVKSKWKRRTMVFSDF